MNSPRIRERLRRFEEWNDDGGLERLAGIPRGSKAASGGAKPRELVDAERAAGDAEQMVARRLGVPVAAVVAAALGTWQRGLTEERDARAAERAGSGATPRTVQAARGHVTRELYREIAPAIKRYRQAVEHDRQEG